MQIDWNPNHSPVFRFITAHAVAALAVLVGSPALTTAMFGGYAAQIQTVLGLLSGLGILGMHYAGAGAPATTETTK